jgi:hypothetical protein
VTPNHRIVIWGNFGKEFDFRGKDSLYFLGWKKQILINLAAFAGSPALKMRRNGFQKASKTFFCTWSSSKKLTRKAFLLV